MSEIPDGHITVNLNEWTRLVQERECMRTALTNIAIFADRASFGTWRHNVYNMAKTGLRFESPTPTKDTGNV